MSITESQKVDYLWKKVGYAATKTDTGALKDATNEEIASPLLIRGDKTWNEASQIPSTKPASTSGVVTVYTTSLPVECATIATASTSRSWKTNLTDWISPEFSPVDGSYLVNVYIHTAGNAGTAAASGTQVLGAGSGNNDEWFFDYQSGVLHFIGTSLPNGVSFTGKSVYISGARYTGTIGLQNLVVRNTVQFEVEDNIILLNSGGSIGNDAGIMINRQSSGNNAVFYWDEASDKFKIVLSTSDGSTVTNLTDTDYVRMAGADPVDAQDFITLNYLATAPIVTLGDFSFSANRITLQNTNADFELDSSGTGKFVLLGTSGLVLPQGDTASRPSAQAGVIRYNTQTSKYEVSQDGSTWTALRTEQTSREVIKDVFTGDGSTVTFTSPNVSTAPENVIVYIDGVMQEPDFNYTTDGSTSSITITGGEAPHIGARVVVISGFADAQF